jgi:hypothetical protein
MKMILPFTVDDTSLLYSNVPESEGPEYDATITYGLAAVVVSSHRAYESLQASNVGHALTNTSWWLDLGPTNRWKMFDQSNGSQTVLANQVSTSVQVTGRADSVALLNVAAKRVNIVASVAGAMRTNMLPWSEALGNAVWTVTGITVTSDATYDASGRLVADKLAETTATSAHKLSSASINMGRNVLQCYSVYLKDAGTGTVQLVINASGANQVSYDFNLTTFSGTATNGGTGSGAGGGYEELADGWIRVWVYGIPDAADTANGVTAQVLLTRLGSSYTGDGASGVYAVAQQLETGNTATPYIITGASAAGTTDTQVYSATQNMVSNAGVSDWWAYYFADVVYKTDLVMTDLPPYPNPRIDVYAIDTGGTVSVGSLILGRTRDIGGTTYGASVSIIDYSKKEADTFGNYVVTQRTFSKRGKFQVVIDGDQVDALATLFAQYRATPVVWIGSDSYTSTFIFGFYRDWNIVVSYPTKSMCELELEGLS